MEILSFVLVAVSALITIVAIESKPPRARLVYIFKPLTTILVIGFLYLRTGWPPDLYSGLILAGLVFSLAGDIFLMLPRDAFLPGLLSFLVTHVFYLAAFARPGGLLAPLLPFVPIAVLAALVASWLWGGVPSKLRIPVVIYIVLLAGMTGQAFARAMTVGGTGAVMAALGSLLFLSSDSLLAINRFKRPLPHHQAWILSTYFLAQWLIAFSAGAGAR